MLLSKQTVLVYPPFHKTRQSRELMYIQQGHIDSVAAAHSLVAAATDEELKDTARASLLYYAKISWRVVALKPSWR
jgi:hypothetical protein